MAFKNVNPKKYETSFSNTHPYCYGNDIVREHENETNVSKNNTSESHKTGENCFICHQDGGGGEGWFTVAGSIYDSTKTQPYANGKVIFTKVENNSSSIIKTIEIDNKGNFYSTEDFSFGNGLIVTVQGRNDEQQSMIGPVTNGSCNQCHGVSVEKIWLK